MLRDSDFRTLVEQAPMIIWRANTTGECDYFNARWLAFTGRTLEQEVGNGWVEGVHPEDLERCFKTYMDAFNRRETFEMEYRLRRHDGAWRTILDRGTPSYAQDGTFQGYIGSCIDVTERVEAVAAMERMHALEVQRLQDLVPVCTGCKKVRDDKGYWHAVDAYLTETAGRKVTHGLCHACLDRLYPDTDDPMA